VSPGPRDRVARSGRGVLHLDLDVTAGAPTTGEDLVEARRRALATWADEHAAGLATQDDPAQQRRSEDAAVQRRLAALPPETGGVRPPTVVVAHRVDWLRHLVEADLLERGVVVSCSTSRRDEALAAVLVDQPDVLVVSDRLVGASGLAVASRARTLAPGTRVVAQVEADGNLRAALEVGADAVLSRSARVQDLVDIIRVLAPRTAEPEPHPDRSPASRS